MARPVEGRANARGWLNHSTDLLIITTSETWWESSAGRWEGMELLWISIRFDMMIVNINRIFQFSHSNYIYMLETKRRGEESNDEGEISSNDRSRSYLANLVVGSAASCTFGKHRRIETKLTNTLFHLAIRPSTGC